jgi:hypothetical protein
MGCCFSNNKVNTDCNNYWYSYDECCVCLDNKCNIVLLPCNHLILCGDCAQDIYNYNNLCPICQTPIQNFCYLTLSIII